MKGRARILWVGVSAGKHCTLHLVVSLTRGGANSPVDLGSMTGERSVSSGCLRRVVSVLGGTNCIEDIENTRNKCVLGVRPRGCAINVVLERARNDLTPMTYVRSSRVIYSERRRYIASVICGGVGSTVSNIISGVALRSLMS